MKNTAYAKLTPRQLDVLAELPKTVPALALSLGITESTVYDHLSDIEKRGVHLAQNDAGEYYEPGGGRVENDVINVSAPVRTTAAQKAAVSRKTKAFLAELEHEIRAYRQEVGPVIADGGVTYTPGGMDIIVPCSDDHYGDLVADPTQPNPYESQPLFDAEIASERIHAKFDHAHQVADAREAMGHTIDAFVVPMLGDHVTNEAIYEQQKWHLEPRMHIREQLKVATDVYTYEIARASARFPSVVVPCFHGNHGEFRQGGQSHHANADDLLYDRLELAVQAMGLENVTFIRSDIDDHILFTTRNGKWTGFGVHGEDVPYHIGTKSPLQWWQAQVNRWDFDFAFRCHYHESKEERVNGVPVHLLPSIKDTGEYEAKLGIYGVPLGVVFGSTDEQPLAFKEWVSYPVSA
ncbi:hypothetical protein [Halorubellus litoreus]|uniref:HTH domain-containing protein n=1 Tax=Halorubellus litoreus TaxID=755308 RepID=A0ABD5VGW2_9EURY